jgi:hypothetical protein
VIVSSFHILTNQRAVFLLYHGVVLSQTLDVVDHKTCFGLHNAHLQILNGLRDVGSKMCLQLLGRLDFIKYFSVQIVHR